MNPAKNSLKKNPQQQQENANPNAQSGYPTPPRSSSSSFIQESGPERQSDKKHSRCSCCSLKKHPDYLREQRIKKQISKEPRRTMQLSRTRSHIHSFPDRLLILSDGASEESDNQSSGSYTPHNKRQSGSIIQTKEFLVKDEVAYGAEQSENERLLNAQLTSFEISSDDQVEVTTTTIREGTRKSIKQEPNALIKRQPQDSKKLHSATGRDVSRQQQQQYDMFVIKEVENSANYQAIVNSVKAPPAAKNCGVELLRVSIEIEGKKFEREWNGVENFEAILDSLMHILAD